MCQDIVLALPFHAGIMQVIVQAKQCKRAVWKTAVLKSCASFLKMPVLGNNRAEQSCFVPEMPCFGNNRAEQSCFVPESACFGNNRAEQSYFVPEMPVFGERFYRKIVLCSQNGAKRCKKLQCFAFFYCDLHRTS